MARWHDFAAAEPEMAAAGHKLLYQWGLGLAFLATVRPDGGPRLHRMCPIIREGGLYAFITKSPKQRDLLRDGRYALHAEGPADNDDEFYVTGRAVAVPADDPIHVPLFAQFMEERKIGIAPGATSNDMLFELHLERALWGVTKGHGDEPAFTFWRAAPSP